MKTLHLDFESASDVDLRKHGLMRYARDISTRALMLSFAFNDEPVRLWQPHLEPKMPADLRAALDDPNIIKIAWNAQFERAIFEFVLDIRTPVEQWRCAMVLALLLSLPGSLKECGKVVGLPEEQQKLKTGATLIRRFCMPREPTQQKPWRWSSPFNEPEDWQLFCDYCVQDTETERRLWKMLSKFYVPESEWALWHYDQEINLRGIPVDVEFCRAAIDVANAEKKRLVDKLKELTGLANPGSTAQILPWLRARGYPFSDMKKDRVAKALEDFDRWEQQPPLPTEPQKVDSKEKWEAYEKQRDRHLNFRPLDDEAKVVLRIHQQSSKTSWKKYQSILDMEFEGRLYFQFQFCGAGRTARWAGRGVQLQNLARPDKAIESYLKLIRELILARDLETLDTLFGNVMLCLVGSIRSAIVTPKGKKFCVADLASIESRTLGWEAKCDALMEVFRQGKCAYKQFATLLFDKLYEEVTKGERQIAKPPVLGCGYRLGGGSEIGEYPDTVKTGLLGYAEIYGVKMTPQEARNAVFLFRSTYPEIQQFWYDLENAAMTALRTKQPQQVGFLQFDVKPPFLRMRLPSGRFIHYLRAKIEKVKTKLPSGDVMEKMQVVYEGHNSKKVWCRIATHGGRYTEQATQGIARDFLAYGMLEARDVGFWTVATIHDEIIAEQDEDDVLDHHELERCMSVCPPWAPGMLLGADGYTDTIYRKN
ncbi:MAG: hypothetical protein V4787_11730 [Pseudomonadota bacterium]